MSYIHKQKFTYEKRRHPVIQVTPEEAVHAANKAVDDANRQIADITGKANYMINIAKEEIARQEKEIAELKAENERLRRELDKALKRVTAKAGKNKKRRDEWFEEEG